MSVTDVGALAVGDNLIAFSHLLFEDEPTLPPISEITPPGELIPFLIEKLAELEVLIEGKADVDQLKTQIAFNDEGIKIQAEEIVLVGNVTIADIINTHNGAGAPAIDATITRIIGDHIQTGAISSNNFGTDEGTQIDLDNETITLGGSGDPKFFYDGAGNLTLSGTLEAGSIIAGSVTVNGTAMSTVEGHLSLTGNVHTVTLTQISGDLDDIADGAAFFRSTANQNTGGGRGFTALDSAADYIRTLSTAKIVLSGSNPTNGVIFDSAGIRMYDGGVIQINLPSSGAPATFSGDIVTSGQVLATGVTISGGLTGAIVGTIVHATNAGVIGINTTGIGIRGQATSGTAINGSVNATNGIAGHFSDSSGLAKSVRLNSLGVGTALEFAVSGHVAGNLVFEDGVFLLSTLDVNGITNLNGAVNMDGHVRLGNSVLDNVAMGGATLTGLANLAIKVGTAGAKLANQIEIYCDAISGGKASLGIVADEAPTTTSTFDLTHRWKITINAQEYWVALDAV